MKNPYVRAVENMLDPKFTVPNKYGERRYLTSDEKNLMKMLLKRLQRMDKKFSIPVVSKLRKIGDQCEAGGHKSRARMFRAIAKEFEVMYDTTY